MDGMAVAVVEGGQIYFVRTDHIAWVTSVKVV